MNNDNDCSLREAINSANSDTSVDDCSSGNGWDTIALPAGGYTLTVAAGGDLYITSSVTIRGDSAATTVIDGDASDRVIDADKTTVILDGVTVTNGSLNGEGACIYNTEGLFITLDSIISRCVITSGSLDGGGIYNLEGVLRLFNTTIKENRATDEGGGIYNYGGITSIQNSTIISNTAGDGGGLSGEETATRISASDFLSNTAVSDSGGLSNDIGTVIVNEGSKFSFNRAVSNHCGGAYTPDSAFIVDDSTISHNQSTDEGGGLCTDDDVWMRDTIVEHNQSTTDEGGGIYGGGYIQNSTIRHNKSVSGGGMYFWGVIEDSLIYGNEADDSGGILAESVALLNSTVRDNRALTKEGGGVYVYNYSAIIVESTIKDNTGASGEEGGGLYTDKHPVTVRSSTINGNTGAQLGGGIYSHQGVIDLLNSTVSDNRATTGGGIYVLNGTVALNYSTIADNSATSTAGGVYNANVTTVESSILAGNRANGSITHSSADCQAVEAITFGGYSLFGSSTGCSASGLNDQTITPANIFVTVLGVLSDNGGPSTGSGQLAFTHALLAGSPALDAISSGTIGCGTSISSDQRGVSRPQGGRCDIGAYEAGEQLLNIAITGTGSGSVTSPSSGIDCSSDCSKSLPFSKTITLTASTDPGSTFSSWGGDCSGNGDCVVIMSQARSVTAEFTLDQHELSVSLAGSGSGSVTSSPAGIDCATGSAGADCTQTYDHLTLVSLTPTADTGSTFAGWSGACTGPGDCNVTMDAAKNVTATFEGPLPIPPTGPFVVFLPLTHK